jgi:trans-aconitate methyltransferase
MDKYQDYVIKDGEFIGAFEEMYQKFDDPWHQKEAVKDSYSRLSSILTIKSYGISSLIEVGCGLGAYAQFMHRQLPDVNIVGMDVSETAVRKARECYPDIDFKVENLLEFSKTGGHMTRFCCRRLCGIFWKIWMPLLMDCQ